MYQELEQVWQELTAPGAPFEVTEVEIRGVRLRAYAGAPPSLREIWLGSAAHGDADYLVYRDERWSYTDAHRDVASVARWLLAQGVGPGDRVAIAMRNYPEWMLAYWATVSIGAVVVGMNAWWTAPELLYGVQDSEPKVMICDAERLERFLPSRAEAPPCQLVAVRSEGPLPEDVLPWSALLGENGGLPDAAIDTDEDACIFYTSGTTGRPKGAQLTHRGCVNNLMSLAFWNTAQVLTAQRTGKAEPSEAGPVELAALVATPLFHVTANNCIAHSATAVGGKLVLMHKWDAGEALALIDRERITNFSGVPVMAREILAHPDFEKTDTSSLKALGGGGAQLQPDLVAKIDRTVKTARPNTGYGMTETCGIITANSADFVGDKPDSVGPAMPCFETKCIDAEGKDLSAGE
ncbi:MAG: class I adenylate-forming enzyme family protein, partial [Myxococcota bacterium]